MVAGLRRSDRDSEDVGDVGQWKIQVVVEDDHDPMVDRKPPEALLQLVAIDDHLDIVAGGQLGVADLDARLEPSPTLRLVDGGVDQDAVQPAVEAVDVAKPGQAPPASDSRVPR